VRVAEGERARIAANLHDGPIQRLAALGLVLDRCSLRLDRDDREGAMDLVKRAREELSEEIRKLREMMSELRPPILDEGGLDAALRDQLSGWSAATGVQSRFETTPHEQLPSDSETVVYRVVQEALANVAKHARANLVTVSVRPSGKGLSVVVWDNGKGFNPRSQREMLRDGHFGLVVMRERVELAAGHFELKSAPLTGTQVIVWVPIAPSPGPGGTGTAYSFITRPASTADGPGGETPVKATPVKATPVKEAPVKEAPVKETLVKETPLTTGAGQA
jgi:signal transduction histidine kinase